MAARNKNDETELLRQFRNWRKKSGDAGIVCAAADPLEDGGGFAVQFGSAGCGPLSLIAIAGTILRRAAERLAAAPEKRLDLIKRVEMACAALEFGSEQE